MAVGANIVLTNPMSLELLTNIGMTVVAPLAGVTLSGPAFLRIMARETIFPGIGSMKLAGTENFFIGFGNSWATKNLQVNRLFLAALFSRNPDSDVVQTIRDGNPDMKNRILDLNGSNQFAIQFYGNRFSLGPADQADPGMNPADMKFGVKDFNGERLGNPTQHYPKDGKQKTILCHYSSKRGPGRTRTPLPSWAPEIFKNLAWVSLPGGKLSKVRCWFRWRA
jgi:hypothetical protein